MAFVDNRIGFFFRHFFGGLVAGSCIDLDFCIEGNCCIVVVLLVYSYYIVVGFEERGVAGSWYSYIHFVIWAFGRFHPLVSSVEMLFD